MSVGVSDMSYGYSFKWYVLVYSTFYLETIFHFYWKNIEEMIHYTGFK